MSCDKVNCSSVILSVVAECSVKVFNDFGVFLTECKSDMSGTVSYPRFLIQYGDFVFDKACDVR